MKKLTALVLTAAIGATLIGATACNGDKKDGYSVYAPDGAPALALSSLMAENNDFVCEVVDSATIQTFVTGENPKADFCILPVNAAAKLLGTGEVYQMLGTVTNGNMYFLSTEEEEITSLTSLIGKTVGVVQLSNVPGLTLRAVLGENQIAYNLVGNDGALSETEVNLKAVEAGDVTPAGGCDYYLCPEPAVTTKIINSNGKFRLVGDLQKMYGENGYPQAVAVVKKDTDKAAVSAFTQSLGGVADYLKTADYAAVNDLLAAHRTEGLKASFTALNSETIANCSVWYTPASECKEAVNAFLAKLIAIDESAAKTVSDAFYYVA